MNTTTHHFDTLIHITLIYYTCHTQTRHILHKRGVTEVHYLLEVSWQMCHAWITHWTVTRAPPTIPRRRSTRDERTHGRNACEPFLALTRARLAPQAPVFESWRATSVRTEEPSMVSVIQIKSSISNTYR